MTTPIKCEARLMGLSKTRRKDGDWTEVRWHIHPDDFPAALFLLPLGTACNLEISGADDETTTEDDAPDEPVKLKGGERARRAGILCNDPDFQTFLATHWPDLWACNHPPRNKSADTAAAIIRTLTGCKESRAELDHAQDSGGAWDQIEHDFYASQRGDTDEARIAQRDRI
jgi:hypothetical protein